MQSWVPTAEDVDKYVNTSAFFVFGSSWTVKNEKKRAAWVILMQKYRYFFLFRARKLPKRKNGKIFSYV